MKNITHRRRFLRALVLIPATITTASWLTARPALALFGVGDIVFDPANYAQNLLAAARALQEIENQIKSLQNEAVMLQNMAKDLQKFDFSSLADITDSMKAIGTLMAKAEGIAFDISTTEAALKEQFPESFSIAATTSQILTNAKAQWQAAMSGFRQTMRVQAQVAENVQSDSTLLTKLVAKSQDTGGNLEAQQAASQLIALSIKQQLQIQQMMAAQYRADALERGREAEALEGARTITKRFVGTSDIYTRP